MSDCELPWVHHLGRQSLTAFYTIKDAGQRGSDLLGWMDL